MALGDRVEILSRGELLRVPKCVVPSAALDPFAGGSMLHALGDPLLHLVQRAHTDQINFELRHPSAAQVQMSVVETRHYKVSAEIDDVGLRTLPLFDI